MNLNTKKNYILHTANCGNTTFQVTKGKTKAGFIERQFIAKDAEIKRSNSPASYISPRFSPFLSI